MNDVTIPKREVSAALMEKVLLYGDLAALTPQERLTYYRNICEGLGLNPLTRPFDYLNLNGKLVLYAKRECTEQLRKIHSVSVIPNSTRVQRVEDVHVVTVAVKDASGRTDEGTGAVTVAGLKGNELANAIMKAETKAKRRATLSIVGLGLLDESEIETIKDARTVTINEQGETHGHEPSSVSENRADRSADRGDLRDTSGDARDDVSAPPPDVAPDATWTETFGGDVGGDTPTAGASVEPITFSAGRRYEGVLKSILRRPKPTKKGKSWGVCTLTTQGADLELTWFSLPEHYTYERMLEVCRNQRKVAIKFREGDRGPIVDVWEICHEEPASAATLPEILSCLRATLNREELDHMWLSVQPVVQALSEVDRVTASSFYQKRRGIYAEGAL